MKALRCILLAFLLLPAPAWASTAYWASPTGSNVVSCGTISSTGTSAAPGTDPGSYGTIGRAATCATAAGDIVNIKAGTYTSGNDRIGGTAIPASGTSTSLYTYIQGNPGGAVPQINLSNWLTFDEQSSTHRNYVSIQDLSISGSGGSDGGGGELAIEGIGIRVQRVTITNSYNMNIASFTPTAASSNNRDHIIQNNSLQGAGGDGCGYGVYTNATGTLIQDNEVTGGKCGGLQVYTDEYAVDNPIIRRNWIHGIAKATQVSVLNYCFGIAVNGANTLVYNNIIDGAGCGTGTIVGGYGIGHFGQTGAYLLAYHNLIINWNSEAIQVGLGAAGAGGNIERNNLLFGNGGTIGAYNSTSNTADHNACSSGCTTTISALTDCTVSTSDYTHKVGSLCFDVGTTVAAVTDDYILTARPQNVAYDIGPYEYVVTATRKQSPFLRRR